MSNKLVLRWQLGPFPPRGAQRDSLDLSIKLMQKLEPDAEYHVVHQGERPEGIDGVIWHEQRLPAGEPYCSGRHMPEKLVEGTQEIYMDSDHIMWGLPPGWVMFRTFGGPESVLIWLADWKYYGNWPLTVDFDICPGMWGVGTGLVMPFPIYMVEEKGGERNQDEYGWSARWLGEQKEQYYISQEEVGLYCPDHIALGRRSTLGSYGAHFNGTNRGWSQAGTEMIYKLREKYL